MTKVDKSNIKRIYNKSLRSIAAFCSARKDLRWLDWIFYGGYLPSLNVNYVGVSRDMEKKLPQLYYIKMKLSYDLGFLAIGVAIAT